MHPAVHSQQVATSTKLPLDIDSRKCTSTVENFTRSPRGKIVYSANSKGFPNHRAA